MPRLTWFRQNPSSSRILYNITTGLYRHNIVFNLFTQNPLDAIMITAHPLTTVCRGIQHHPQRSVHREFETILA